MTAFFIKKSQKIFTGILLCFSPFLSISPTFANNCSLANGPIEELSQYAKNIDNELSEIFTKAQKNKSQCGVNFSQKASRIFDTAYADLSAMQHTFTDFWYHTKLVLEGNSRSEVMRDGKIFENIETKIDHAAEQLAKICGFNDENRIKLKSMIIELHLLKNAFQKTALGTPPTQTQGIRAENIPVFEAITRAYHPSATTSCNNGSAANKNFAETLKNMMNVGGKMEDALSTWRRGLALLRGGGDGMSVSEYQRTKRNLLSNELSRQGMTANMQKAILKNFDCFQAKVGPNGDEENFLKARLECLSNPIIGIERNLDAFKNFIGQSKTRGELVERQEALESVKARSINIVAMHQTLSEMTKFDNENSEEILTALIKLHVRLQSTSTLLEKRLPKMQNNCMKWQPDVVGGCGK